jgi:hypothetical protein
MNSVWDRLPELSDAELRALVEAALSVLRDEAGTSVDFDPSMPPRRLRTDLRQNLEAEGLAPDDATLERLVADDETSREVATALLESIAEQPALQQEVERVYEERRGMMLLDGGVLLGSALLLLVMKLKHLKVERGKLDVGFYEASDTAIARVARIVRGG